MNARMRNQAGFAIVGAVFLIVLLATVGAYILAGGARQGVVPDRALIAGRSYIANRNALEWALYQAVAPPQNCSAPGGEANATVGNCAASTTFTMLGYGLDDVTAAVTCSVPSKGDNCDTGSQWAFVYNLTAMIGVGVSGTGNYVERKLEAEVCRSNDRSGTEC